MKKSFNNKLTKKIWGALNFDNFPTLFFVLYGFRSLAYELIHLFVILLLNKNQKKKYRLKNEPLNVSCFM